jgi:molybdate transport system ATP-binding protein
VLDVELEVARPTTIIGPSGAGKSTLLRLVAGLLRPQSGLVECGEELWFDGRRSTPPERRRIGFVFQDYALFPNMTVHANVAYGACVPVDPLLERIGILHLAAARPRALSGGERQRVALARALARQPKLLLLDEPLSALDPNTRGRIGDQLRAVLDEAGVPALIVTHSYEEAVSLAERVVVLEEGRVTQRGRADDLLRAPQTAFIAQFAGLNYLEGAAGGRDVLLDSGERVHLAEPARGRIAVLIPPWQITVTRGPHGDTSAQNHLTAPIADARAAGSRVRLAVGPLTAEITAESYERLGLGPGDTVTASFKSTAIRTIPLRDDAGNE